MSKPVLLTDESLDGERVLVAPRRWCLTDVRAHAALIHAATFGEARRGAELQIEEGEQNYLERLREEDREEDEDLADEAFRRRHTGSSYFSVVRVP